MEPHGDGTGIMLLRNTRRAFCRVRKGVGGGEQSDSRRADDHGRRRRPTFASTCCIMPVRLSDVGRGERKHVVISFPAVAQGVRWLMQSPDSSARLIEIDY